MIGAESWVPLLFFPFLIVAAGIITHFALSTY